MHDTSAVFYVEQALAAGFSHAAPLSIGSLHPLHAVRKACEANRCGMYGSCWTCPPGCGTLPECDARIQMRTDGLLVQSVGPIADGFDYAAMRAVEKAHQARFAAFAKALRGIVSELLPLGAGCCNACQSCAYPDAPCRLPERAFPAMEAYGLLVLDVCRDNGLAYHYGSNAVAFTGCYLWKARA